MSETIRIELTEKEWVVVSVVMAEFVLMFADYLKHKPLEFSSILRKGLADTEFSNDMMSAGDQLRIVDSMSKGEKLPTVAERQRHSALISVELEKVEFVVLQTCWQAMITLLGQAMQNKELKMPVEGLPPAKFYERLGQDLDRVMRKLPIMQDHSQVTATSPHSPTSAKAMPTTSAERSPTAQKTPIAKRELQTESAFNQLMAEPHWVKPLAIASLVLSIIALPTAILGCGLLFSPLAVILGLIAYFQAKKSDSPRSTRLMALAGTILGGLLILLLAIMMIAALISQNT